jgi:hypothetical protein
MGVREAPPQVGLGRGSLLKSSPFAGCRLGETDVRGLLVPHVSRDPEEGDRDSKNNPNIDAHGNLCRVNAFPNRSPHNEKNNSEEHPPRRVPETPPF